MESEVGKDCIKPQNKSHQYQQRWNAEHPENPVAVEEPETPPA